MVDTPAENQLHFSNGDGTFRLATAFNLTDQNFYRSDGCYSARTANFNGDGLSDVFRHRKDSIIVNGSSQACPAGTTEIFLGNGDGSFVRKPVTLRQPEGGESARPWLRPSWQQNS